MTDRDARFACRCCGKNWIDPRVVAAHRDLEERVGQPLEVSSGFRCEKHNHNVGGSATSSHLKGLAWDLPSDNSRLRFQIVAAAVRMGIDRIGIGKTFIHLDMDRQKDHRVIWVY